jgi:hypothetical protein
MINLLSKGRKGLMLLLTLVKVVRNNLFSIAALAQHMPAPFVATLTLQDLKFKWLGESLLPQRQ